MSYFIITFPIFSMSSKFDIEALQVIGLAIYLDRWCKFKPKYDGS